MSQPDLVELFAGRFESELKTSQTGDYHGEAGYPAGYHAPHCVGHLWEKDPEVTRLVWSQVRRDDSRRRSQAHCSSGIQAVPQREKVADSPSCQEQSSANRQTLCQWVLVRVQWNNPESSNYREHQRDEWWHQDSQCITRQLPWNPPLGRSSQTVATDGGVGGALFRPLLQTECCDDCSPPYHRVPSSHGRSRHRTDHRALIRPSTAWPQEKPQEVTGFLPHPHPPTWSSTAPPLSVLERKGYSTRHEGCQDRYPLQKQRCP